MAGREYTIPISGTNSWDRATIFELDGGWYYCLRQVDPHGEEYTGESVGPFPTADEAERQARADYIPRPDEV